MKYEELYNQAMKGDDGALESLDAKAAGGDYEAQYVLSFIYDNVESPFKDTNLGMHWLKTSASYGYEPALKKIKEFPDEVKRQYGLESKGDSYIEKYFQESDNYQASNKKDNTTSSIIGIIISIGLIIAGLSGEFVLIGTNSSIALVVAGCIFLIIDIIKLVL